jgi:hypothetical protein
VHGNFAANGQPQAGAAEPARDRGISLIEWQEDLCQMFVADADARVANFDDESRFRPGKIDTGNECHATPLGELDRVADEIDQKLAHSHWIGANGFRHAAHPATLQGDCFFLSSDPQDRHDFRNHAVRRALYAFELHPAGLDFRQVEDVVN